MRDLQAITTANGSFVIFAAQPNQPEVVMSFMVENLIKFKVLLGSYKNERETSYCVPADEFAKIVEAGIVDEQESILVLGPFNGNGLRKAEIVYLAEEGKTEPAGFFSVVSREQALSGEGWTFDPMSDSFFTLMSAADLVASGINAE